MYLFFDTETTGLPDFNKPVDDPAQPYIVQIAMVVADEDGRELVSYKTPIIPQGFRIDEGGRAYEVNKVSNDMAMTYGIPITNALRQFQHLESRCKLKVAHNYRFDGFLLKTAHARADLPSLSPAIDKYCTMRGIADIRGEKFPKLATIYKELTGRDLDNAHDALADVRACKDVFFWIKKQGLLRDQPRVGPKTEAA